MINILWDVRGFDVVFVLTNVQICTDFSLACGLEVWLIVNPLRMRRRVTVVVLCVCLLPLYLLDS